MTLPGGRFQRLSLVLLVLAGFSQSGHAARFEVSADGSEVKDLNTRLIWRRCAEGTTWQGGSCQGAPDYYMWHEALFRAKAQAVAVNTLWRVPNVKELASLVDFTRGDGAIDPDAFPGTRPDQFWSATPYAQDPFYGWVVNFDHGAVYYSYLEDLAMLRLVRDPQ